MVWFPTSWSSFFFFLKSIVYFCASVKGWFLGLLYQFLFHNASWGSWKCASLKNILICGVVLYVVVFFVNSLVLCICKRLIFTSHVSICCSPIQVEVVSKAQVWKTYWFVVWLHTLASSSLSEKFLLFFFNIYRQFILLHFLIYIYGPKESLLRIGKRLMFMSAVSIFDPKSKLR